MSESSATTAAVNSADAPRREKKRRSRPRREALPLGWAEMRHNNGLPFYYHLDSGTVCWTRPYVRKFKVEEHAPLLSSFAVVLEDDEQVKAVRDEDDEQVKAVRDEDDEQVKSGSGLDAPTEEPTHAESIDELDEGNLLEQAEELLEEGELVEDAEMTEELDSEARDPMGDGDRPGPSEHVPEGDQSGPAIRARALELVSLIVAKEKRRKKKSPAEYGTKRGVKKRSAEDLSGVGKTPISFLQEYCLNIIKKTPAYRVTIQEDSKAPFVTEVVLDDAVIGRGSFSNKKTSKQLAALESLEALCPGQYPRDLLLKNVNLEVALKDDLNETRHLAIDDEKIMNLDGTSAKTPVQVLQEYCNREGTYVHYQSEELAASETRTRFVVTAALDQLQAEGTGKTKKEAKQRAAQLLLKQLHADINTWGELLDYYEMQKEQHKDKGPNLQLLNMLKEKMRSIIQEQHTALQRGQEVTPVVTVTSEAPLVTPVMLGVDTEFYRIKDKSCKDLDVELNATPSHSPVTSRHNSFIHKARARKEPQCESAAQSNEPKVDNVNTDPSSESDRPGKRKRDDYENEEQLRKMRKIDEPADNNNNTVKNGEFKER